MGNPTTQTGDNVVTTTRSVPVPKAARVTDPEVRAMSKLLELFEGHDPKTQWRLLCWINSRFGYGQSIGTFAEQEEAS